MRETIIRKLHEIEKTENVRILLAVESGSRAWGFASPDSDYDVRFIYVRPKEDYLRLEKIRDVIELPLDDVLDINGWDLQKALRLLYKSNPTLFEWAASPIVYMETEFAGQFRNVMNTYFSTKKSLYHYISMAEGNYREFLRGANVKAKKYFYVMRPVLACRWILEKGTPPPMRFTELMAAELPGELPVKTGAALLDINRTSVYYKGMPISQEELDCKSIIDRLHTDNPAWGARQLSAQLKKRGHQVGRRKTRRYMNEMGIDPIYPKMNLSKRMQQAKVCPYLLRNAVIDRPNQAWSIDITYIPIKHGFLYLTAVIDWYSRCIVGWEVDDTLDTRMVITALKKAFMVAKPIILNSDQGCQFTSNEYMNFLKENQIRQSMDGKSRWADNIMIERWFRSFKYEEAYLTQYNNIREARKAIGKYVHTYNFERCHSALNNQTPASCYYPILLLDDHAA